MAPPRISRGPSLRLLRILRTALLLGALVLLSTIFLLSRSIDPELAIRQSELDIDELTRAPRIGTARMASVTREDTAITVEAVTVRALSDVEEMAPLRMELDQPIGRLEFPSARQVDFQGNTGLLDQDADLLTMHGEVVLHSSDGYIVHTAILTAALNRTEIHGTGGVRGTGPPGEIEADTLQVLPSPADPSGYLLAFRGNVRVIYTPEPQ